MPYRREVMRLFARIARADGNDGFECQPEKLFRGCVKILGETPHNEIQNQKDSLPREEKVIDAAHESDRKSKYTFSVLVNGFFHGNQHQRKEGGNILKVVEKEVKQLKSRKRIQQSAN